VDSLHSRAVSPSSQARNLSFLAGRVPQLDGLRGVAILLVISLHYLNDSEHGAFGSFLYRFGCAFRLGWSGVDLFFVLSGFLIGGILLDARRAENYFSVFYTRRLFRILPLFYAWLSLFAVVSLFFGRFLSRYLPVLSADFRLLPSIFFFCKTTSFSPTPPSHGTGLRRLGHLGLKSSSTSFPLHWSASFPFLV